MSQKFHNLTTYSNVGQTIKLIRKKKNLSQGYVAADIPLSTYRKIENDVTVPTLVNFFSILSNLEISLIEFMYIHNKNRYITKERLLYTFKNLSHTLNKTKLKAFIKDCKQYLSFQTDQDIKNMLVAMEALQILDYENNREKAAEMCQAINNELKTKENWFYWDALVAQTIMLYLDNESADILASKIRDAFDYYDDLYPAKASKVRVLLNLAYCLKLNNDILSAEKQVDIALKESKNLDEKYLYYDALYKKAEILLAKDQRVEANRLAQESFDGLAFLNKREFLADNKADWEIMLKKYAK
ncbi:transcriptional activator [Listeria monocytogenes]|uniref:XRE family transcriptional regulator n=1 Tax=Listeria monocytogenes TaxID=1639 RepID=A0A823IS48_LISMN|nr:helix-turn-helix transcriptional regulator [Listeria monocytogenes]EAG9355049.1 XRE family transcriptional regulator [Listeria monocytogenes]RFQ28483.1 transcriptional activator [Listeria monocytogenes]UIJ56420.1 helix-turn-helix domain-containing protein [Listeria monocytogenes]WIH38228.1 helix-turn-helix domain-containing protein [Listeria monocytogenes]